MLSRIPFYHGTTKRMVISVGSLFANIFCVTKDRLGVTKKIVTVPLAYLNKEKFIVRLKQDPTLNEDAEITLPRLSYEIVGMDYDSVRQLNKINKVNGETNNRSVYTYAPVPYNLTFNVYSYTRTMDDTFQIMEQIVPYFTPDLNLSIRIKEGSDEVENCSLTLNNHNIDDQYDGSFEDRRYIIATYSFTLKMNYYGPVFGIDDPEKHFGEGPAVQIIKKVQVNLNSNKYTATVNPFEADAGGVFNIDEGWAMRDKNPATDFDQDRKL